MPTAFVEPGARFTAPDGPFVVKPAVGAGSRDTAAYRVDRAADGRAHVERLHARGRSVLVQPLLASVAREGEWALVFLGGRFSHAAAKRVALPGTGVVDGLFAAETATAHAATADQRAVADAALAVVAERGGTAAYARVDLVRDDAGQHRVLEVELVEPSLFLPQGGPDAARRLAAVLTAA